MTLPRLLASLVSLALAATVSHAAAPTDIKRVDLVAFPADGKPATLALPNTLGAGELAVNGVLTFRGKQHKLDPEQANPIVRRYAMRAELGRLYFVLEYKQADADDKQRTAVSRYNVKGKTDLEIAGSIAFAAIDLDKNELAWTARVSNGRYEGGWELAESPTTFFVRVLDGAYALAKPSGRYRWIFNQNAHDSGLNERYLLSWKFIDKSVVFDVTNRVDFEMHPTPPTKYELDVDTGLRTYRVTKAPKLEARPLYVWHHQVVEYRGDRPAPKLPETFDGLWLERTALIWSKTTREGIIINPQLALLPQIVATAKKQSVGGKPVAWKYVIDVDAAAKTFPPTRMRYEVLAKYQDPFIGPDGHDEILFWPLAEWWNSGEKIVAAEVAKQLGAATLPSPTPEKTTLAAAPLFFFRDNTVHHRASISDNDVQSHIKVKWGPYVFYQRSREPTYYKMEK